MSKIMHHSSSRLPIEIWILLGANTIVALGFGFVSPVLSAYARHFGVTISAATFVITIFAITRLLFAPISGILVHHYGERKIYIIGIIIVAITTIACAFIQSYYQLLFFRGLAGVGSTMFFIAALGLIIRASPVEARGRASGMLATAFLLGTVGGPLLGSCTASLGLSAPFFLYGILLLTAAIIVFLRLAHSPLAAPVISSSATLSVRAALKDPAYRAVLVANFATGWSVFGLRVALIPLFITELLHQTTAMAGVVLAMIALGNLCVVLPSGELSDRIGRRKLLFLGLTLTSFFTILLGYASSLGAVLLIAYLLGASSGLYVAPQQAVVADIVGNQARAGTALAVYQMMSDCGSIVGSLGTGFLAQYFSFTMSFVISAMILFLAAVMWFFSPDTHQRQCINNNYDYAAIKS